MGDIGIYDVARGTKSRVLWSSLYAPLTYSTEKGDIADVSNFKLNKISVFRRLSRGLYVLTPKQGKYIPVTPKELFANGILKNHIILII